jgi:hypothetical protein
MTKKRNIVPRKYEDLTLKQRRFIKFYLKSGNGTEAALKAYDTTDRVTAATIGSENLRKLREPVKMLMESKGLGLGRLLEVLDDGLKSNKIHGTNDNFIEIPDQKARHAFLQTAGKWLGVEGKKEADISITHSNVGFFAIPSEKRAEWSKKFNKFVRKEAFKTEVFEAEGAVEKKG